MLIPFSSYPGLRAEFHPDRPRTFQPILDGRLGPGGSTRRVTQIRFLPAPSGAGRDTVSCRVLGDAGRGGRTERSGHPSLALGPRLADVTTACPRCGAPASLDARFCAVCGAALAGCPTCGSAIPVDARLCPSCGRAVCQHGPAEERKIVTVLFADLVGSTAIAEGRD